MADSLEEARYQIVDSLDNDINVLAYVANHADRDTRVVLAGGNAPDQVALAGALIASISHRAGADVEDVASGAVAEAKDVEIGSVKDI